MKIKDLDRTAKHKTTIGGQALIEGILMRGPKKMSIAVRKPNNEIDLKVDKLETLAMKNKFFGLPFIRGVVGLVESMVIGIKALTYSVDFLEEEEDYEESFIDKKLNEKSEDTQIFLTILFSLAISLLLFMILPNLLTSLIKGSIKSPIVLNLIEGAIRLTIFFIYLYIISRTDDIGRVFEYHGAEHKTIHCYENGDELTVENVKKYPILHPRCGTSFMFMVMIVSILVLSFFGWPSPVMRIVIRLLMLPVISGISYEINRLIGKSNSKLACYLSYPGMLVQKYATVKEPDASQIEVAIEALKLVIPENKDEDLWK